MLAPKGSQLLEVTCLTTQIDRNGDDLRREVVSLLEALSSNLPTRIQAADIGRAKLPYKVLSFREALCWRIEELARNSLALLDDGQLAAGALLSRAVVECAAASWHLKKFVDGIVERGVQASSDDTAMKLLLGSRIWDEMPQAVNVLTMLKKADEEISGILGHYERLSEYAHPNWLGTSFLFSRNLEEELATEFGRQARGNDNLTVLQASLVGLATSLGIFEFSYNGISQQIQGLVAKCELELDKPGA